MTGTGLKKYEARQHFGATGSRCQVLRGTSEYNYAGFEIDDGIFPRKKTPSSWHGSKRPVHIEQATAAGLKRKYQDGRKL